MYICNCAAVRESEVRGAIATGARTVAEIFDAVGKEQSCRQCTSDVEEMISNNPTVAVPAITIKTDLVGDQAA